MMRKITVFLLVLLIVCVCCQIGFAEDIDNNTWLMSDDGVVEIRLVSFEEDTYPTYQSTYQLRLDGETMSAIHSSSYDLTTWVNSYASNNPEYNSRKVPIKVAEQFSELQHLRGTMYRATISASVGKDDNFSYSLITTIDLARLYPDEFVNYDIIQAASMIKELKEALYNPDSFTLRSAMLYVPDETPEIQLYVFEVSAQVRAGGINTITCIARYDSSTSNYLIYNLTSSETIVNHDDIIAFMNMMLECVTYSFSRCTPYELSIDSIIQAVN